MTVGGSARTFTARFVCVAVCIAAAGCARAPELALDVLVAGASEVRWLMHDSTFAVAELGRGVSIVDASTGELRAAWRQPTLPSHPARGLATSASGGTLAVASEDSVRVIRSRDGALLFSAPGGGQALALSDDGRTLAWSDGAQGRVLDVPGGALRSEHSLPAGRNGLVWSPATGTFAWTDARKVLLLGADGRPAGELGPFNQAPPSQLASSEGGAMLAVAESTTFVSFWDVRAAQEKRRVRLLGRARFERLAVSADTRYLGLAFEGRARILMALTGRKVADWSPHSGGAVRDLAFSHDGHRLATVGPDGHVRIWTVPVSRSER